LLRRFEHRRNTRFPVMRVPTLPPVCTQPPDLGTTSSQRPR
jgi:hypothetical protein